MQTYYLIRSQADGSYLVAHPETQSGRSAAGYLLLFREHFDALSYVNTHAPNASQQIAVETIVESQIPPILKRWSFAGMGLVQDPLIPKIDFLTSSSLPV